MNPLCSQIISGDALHGPSVNLRSISKVTKGVQKNAELEMQGWQCSELARHFLKSQLRHTLAGYCHNRIK